MKVAEVTYHGQMTTHNRKGESGQMYRFTNPVDGEPTATAVHSVRDAARLDQQDVFDVEWTAQGKVARMVGDSVSEAGSVLSELTYRQKQRLTSALSVDVKGNAPEEELDEALAPAVEEMTEQLETKR